MFKWFRSSNFELPENEKEFAKSIEGSKEHSKIMHEKCMQVLLENAEVMGKAGIEIDFNKDVYINMTDFERAEISNKWLKGYLEAKIEELKYRETIN